MGDRGNIRVVQGAELPDVFLYTHWGGSDIAADLQAALGRRQRWDDPAYLTRIIFDEMTKGQQGSETGAGISTMACDNEHTVLRVIPGGINRGPGVVQALHPSVGEQMVVPGHAPAREVTFEDFIKLDAHALQTFFEPDGG